MFSAPCWCALYCCGQRSVSRHLPSDAATASHRPATPAATASGASIWATCPTPGSMSSRPPSTRVVRAARRGATSRSRSPQTTSVGTRTRAATAHSDSPRHQLRSIAFAVRSNASWAQGWRLRASSSAAASARRCSGASVGSPKHSRTTLSMRSRLVIAASPSRARRPAGPGSAREDQPRVRHPARVGPAVGHGGRDERERTHKLRPPGRHHERDRAAEGVAQQVHRTAAPGEEAQQRVGVPGRRVVGRGGRAGEAEAGQVDGQARSPAAPAGPRGRSSWCPSRRVRARRRPRRRRPGVSRTCRVTPPAVISRPGHGRASGSRGGRVAGSARRGGRGVAGRGRDTSVASGRTASDDSVITLRA